MGRLVFILEGLAKFGHAQIEPDACRSTSRSCPPHLAGAGSSAPALPCCGSRGGARRRPIRCRGSREDAQAPARHVLGRVLDAIRFEAAHAAPMDLFRQRSRNFRSATRACVRCGGRGNLEEWNAGAFSLAPPNVEEFPPTLFRNRPVQASLPPDPGESVPDRQSLHYNEIPGLDDPVRKGGGSPAALLPRSAHGPARAPPFSSRCPLIRACRG